MRRELSQYDCWAKTGEGDLWHALPYHLIDVGAVAMELWQLRLPPTCHDPVPWADADPAQRVAWLAFFAASHDTGKANPYFQAKSRPQLARLKHAFPQVTFCPDDKEPGVGHGSYSCYYLRKYLEDRWCWPKLFPTLVAMAIGGHHGVFPTDDTPTRANTPPWNVLGNTLLDTLAATFGVTSPPPDPAEHELNAFLGWLSGFVCVADWLGSHESMVTWQTGEINLSEYLDAARGRARNLLAAIEWHTPPPSACRPLSAFLPPGAQPNPLQQTAAAVRPDFGLAIIEAPTGEGKTEAAFALSESARAQGAGIYFALPTMATANGLFERVRHYLQQPEEPEDDEIEEDPLSTALPSPRLLHSGAWLMRKPDQRVALKNHTGDDSSHRSTAFDWFAAAKRGLLSPYAVGTIDQALIAALRARHGFVRLFALAGKVVVIDEVHAYDLYMSGLLDVLLGWLRALGSRVLLLSATLPPSRRNALLAAWGVKHPPEVQYPAITVAYADGSADSQSFRISPRKPVRFECLPSEDDGAESHSSVALGVQKIRQLVLERGGLGCLLLNTVKASQEAYRLLCELGGVEVILFHARFTAHDRSRIEKQVLQRFGKAGPRGIPAICVATQVVEQSLDLDFDHMVTELAPVDLLIQRVGRLHRHKRHRNGTLKTDHSADERPDPVAHVLVPAATVSGVPEVRSPIYAKLLLIKTLNWLSTAPVLAQPADVAQAVEFVYDNESPEALQEEWIQQLAAAEDQYLTEQHKYESAAGYFSIPAANDPMEYLPERSSILDENDERQGSRLAARTRLEDRPSVTVAILQNEDGELRTVHGRSAKFPRPVAMASLSITPSIDLWKEIISLESIPEWKDYGKLAKTKPLILPLPVLGKYHVTYDSTYGLSWRKLDATDL